MKYSTSKKKSPVWPLVRVHPDVLLERARLRCGVPAHAALVRALARVRALVRRALVSAAEPLVAVAALVRLLAWNGFSTRLAIIV